VLYSTSCKENRGWVGEPHNERRRFLFTNIKKMISTRWIFSLNTRPPSQRLKKALCIIITRLISRCQLRLHGTFPLVLLNFIFIFSVRNCYRKVKTVSLCRYPRCATAFFDIHTAFCDASIPSMVINPGAGVAWRHKFLACFGQLITANFYPAVNRFLHSCSIF